MGQDLEVREGCVGVEGLLLLTLKENCVAVNNYFHRLLRNERIGQMDFS